MSAKTSLPRLCCTLLCALALAACGADSAQAPQEAAAEQTGTTDEPQDGQPDASAQNSTTSEEETTMERITITVNGQDFEALLEDNDCGRAFADLLPLELAMSELNGNEKYCYTDLALPSDPSRVGHIEAGDLMLYGSDCVVLFYQSFDTSYSYTRIGRLADPAGIAEAAGTGSATVTFARNA